MRSGALPDPGAAALRPQPRRGKQMFAALHRPPQHGIGSGIAIKPQQAEYRAGAAADDVELLIRSDEIVAEQFGCDLRIGEHGIIVQAFRRDAQAVHDRAKSHGAADAKRARHARRVAAFQIAAQLRKPGHCKFA